MKFKVYFNGSTRLTNIQFFIFIKQRALLKHIRIYYVLAEPVTARVEIGVYVHILNYLSFPCGNSHVRFVIFKFLLQNSFLKNQC